MIDGTCRSTVVNRLALWRPPKNDKLLSNESEIEGLQVFAVRIADITFRQRFDVCALLRGRFHLQCFLDRPVGLDLAGLVYRHVVIGADRFRHAPVRHGELRIQLSRALKGTTGFVMVKGVNQAKSLVDRAVSSKGSVPVWLSPYYDFAQALSEYRHHRYEKSIECYERAVRIDPDFAEAYSSLGLAHSRMGRSAEAVGACFPGLLLTRNGKSSSHEGIECWSRTRRNVAAGTIGRLRAPEDMIR